MNVFKKLCSFLNKQAERNRNDSNELDPPALPRRVSEEELKNIDNMDNDNNIPLIVVAHVVNSSLELSEEIEIGEILDNNLPYQEELENVQNIDEDSNISLLVNAYAINIPSEPVDETYNEKRLDSEMFDFYMQPDSCNQQKLENVEGMGADKEIHLFIDDLNSQSKTGDEIDNKEQNAILSVYIDAKILEPLSSIDSCVEKEGRRFAYEINGTVFYDNDTKLNELLKEADKLLEFELTNPLFDQHASSFKGFEVNQLPTEKSKEIQKELYADTLEVPILIKSIQNTRYGLVINSNILLTENAWNTIVCEEELLCLACNIVLDIPDIAEHIVTDNHKTMLDKFKPLHEFDINIVRKINGKYHCAVCNTTFDIDDTEHLESQPHGHNKLTSINKVSDITQPDVNSDSGHNENKYRDNDYVDFNAIVEDSSGFDSESFDGFYDDVGVNDSEVNNRQSDQNLFSYADIAKKPKAFTTSKYVQVKLDNKHAKVTFDSWNMIITVKMNNFYCMACREDGPIRYKSEHCLKVSHVENLMKCHLIPDYKEHVIRKVDHKFYHCGHCNNLQMIHEIAEHIETTHIKKSSTANVNISEIAPLNKITQKVPKKDNKISYSSVVKSANSVNANNNSKTEGITKENDKKTAITTAESRKNPTPPIAKVLVNPTQNTTHGNSIVDQRTLNNGNRMDIHVTANEAFGLPRIPNVLPTENDLIVIREFGQSFRVSLLAYHLIVRRTQNEYFCWICEVWCVNVWNHIVDPFHVARIANAPFLLQTTLHLIRHIKYAFHCIFCNRLIQNHPLNHTWDQMHQALLNRAIFVTPSQRPVTSSHIRPPVFHNNTPSTSITNSKQAPKENDENIDTENKDNGKTNGGNNENKVTETVAEKDFDTEECLYIKIKNNYSKITMTSYNTLVQTGNGVRYCVLCCTEVFFEDLKTHISSPDHLLNLEKYKFLEKYGKHLLRQMSKCYHCALCNVCILKTFINEHISWPAHKETENAKIVKHIRRNEIKSGVKEITCSTQKEIVDNDTKNEFQILVDIEFRLHSQHDIVKKKKIVSLNNVVLKLSWDAYHGVCKNKTGYKCIICQTDFKTYELSAHIESSHHVQILEDRFQLQFTPALIRKVNDSTLHCLTCNVEIANEGHAINPHISTKRHINKYSATIADKTDSDIVDNNDILVLEVKGSGKKKVT